MIGLTPDMTAVEVVRHGVLRTTFADGLTGEIEVLKRMWGPVFARARTPEGFREAFLDDEGGTVAWPGGADLAPDTLYERVRTGKWYDELPDDSSTHEAPIDVDRYLILVEDGPPSNYSAWSPDVLGCVATGNTVDECVTQMREALVGHLAAMRADGEAPPEPTGPGVYVERSAVSAA